MKITENRNMALFSFGKATSLLGSGIYTFAIGLYVLETTGSGLGYASTLALGVLPVVLLNPFAGLAADMLDRKKMAVSMDAANGILFFILYAASAYGGLSIPMVYAGTFMSTSFTVFFAVSMEASKPRMVSGEKLLALNSISKIIDSATASIAPFAGGIIFALVDIRFFMLFNGISFAVSAASEMLMDFDCGAGDGCVGNADSYIGNLGSGSGRTGFMLEGIRYIKHDKEIAELFMTLIILNFVMGLSVLVPLPYLAIEVLGMGSGTYGFIQTMFPVGMVLGASVVGKGMKMFSAGELLLKAGFVLAGASALLGLPVSGVLMESSARFNSLVLALAMGIGGVAVSFIDIPLMHKLQTEVPADLLGRVLSLGIALAKIALPAGFIIAGTLIEKLPPWFLPMAGGAILAVFCTVLTSRRNHSIEHESLATGQDPNALP